MYEPQSSLRIPKYLVLQHKNVDEPQLIYYEENIDNVIKNLAEGREVTIFVREGSAGFYWSYFCNAKKEN